MAATQTYFLQTGVAIETLIAEEASGGALDIALYGNSFAQSIIGNSGDGYDTASYILSSAGVDVDLNRLGQTGGAAAGDRLTG